MAVAAVPWLVFMGARGALEGVPGCPWEPLEALGVALGRPLGRTGALWERIGASLRASGANKSAETSSHGAPASSHELPRSSPGRSTAEPGVPARGKGSKLPVGS